MKIFFTFLTLFSLLSSALVAQTIVGTNPENKNIVLEEFTGIHCVFCPDGHVIAQGIQNNNPDDVVLINIHTGGYAQPNPGEPDFRTEWGAVIAGQSGLVGYPAGTVNRHLFPGWSQGSGTAMSRSNWAGASNQFLAEPSYLNVGSRATIITSTRQLLVEVEVYYTDDSPQSTNYLNIAILQNNILGPQTGGDAGNNYNHMHMLRELLTGQWGVEITETTTGSLYSKTIVYEIPNNYNDVDVILEDIDIVAFVTESHQEVVSGISAGDIIMITANDYDAGILTTLIPQTVCTDEITPIIEMKNYGLVNLTSLDIYYSINNSEEIYYPWTGNLVQNESAEITLPTVNYTPTDNNIINVRCELPNGETDELPQNDNYIKNFEGSQTFPENCYFILLVSGNTEEITWSITDDAGFVIEEGGPYTSTGLKVHPFSFPSEGCFNLNLNDATGSGLMGKPYSLVNEAEEIIWEGGDFTYTTNVELAHDIIIDINETLSSDHISIYPNPITNIANIEFNLFKRNEVNIAVYDILGKQIKNLYQGEMMSGANNIQVDVSTLNEGVYFVKLQMNNQVITKKIMINN